MLEFFVLGSSSQGNSILVRSPSTALLVDAGLSARELMRRLEGTGTRPEELRAICVSHEHSDHINGLDRMQRLYHIPIYANRGTADAARRRLAVDARKKGTAFGANETPEPHGHWKIFSTGATFEVGDIQIHPFSVPHDASEPVGFTLEHDGARLGIATDLGMATQLIRERLRTCHGLILEANHDTEMLKTSPRSWALKQRILGRLGHLSNEAAACLLSEIAGPHLQVVFLAHLSSECNDPEIARKDVDEQLVKCGHHSIRLELTYPDRISTRGCLAAPT